MKKIMMVLLIFSIGMVAACSNDDEEQSADHDVSTESSVEDSGFTAESEEAEMTESAQDEDDSGHSHEVPENTEATQQDRKIIYTADMRIEVRDYQDSLRNLQTSISDYGGYIVESTMYEETETNATSGYVTARIPQAHFDAFIDIVARERQSGAKLGFRAGCD